MGSTEVKRRNIDGAGEQMQVASVRGF